MSAWSKIKDYIPRLYVPARRSKQELATIDLMNRQGVLNQVLMDTIINQKKTIEKVKDEAIAMLSAIVLKHSGVLDVPADIIETINQSNFRLVIERKPDGAMHFNLEKNEPEELAGAIYHQNEEKANEQQHDNSV